MFCVKCGKEIQEGTSFCAHCGCAVGATPRTVVQTVAASERSVLPGKLIGDRSKHSYIVSIIGAIISFFIRLGLQDKYIYWDTLVENTKVMGIDRDIKPFVTFLPVIAAVIVALMISSDKETSVQNKVTVFIKNAAIIALALVFIWLDIPYQIFDF